MVLVTHSGENTIKTDNILKVAQKRFGLYGLEKTTMKEIAADLTMSKASLYYYFPDKEHLFVAVVEMEQEEFFNVMEQTREKITDPVIMLKEYSQIRLKYFKTLFNLSRLRLEEFQNIKPMLSDILNKFRDREIEIIREIISAGNKTGVLQTDNPSEMATLYIEIIKGLRMQVIHNKDLLYIEPGEYDILEKKLNMFTDIFIHGLKTKN